MKQIIVATLLLPWLGAELLFGGLIAQGILVGGLVTGGIFATLGIIPGFWWLANNKAGGLFLALLTAVLAHTLLGGHSVTAIIGAGWAFVAKGLILNQVRAKKGLSHGKQQNLAISA
jgi:hypothetical protein